MNVINNFVSVEGAVSFVALAIIIAFWAAFGSGTLDSITKRNQNRHRLTRQEMELVNKPTYVYEDGEKNPLASIGLEGLTNKLTPDNDKLRRKYDSQKVLEVRDLIIKSGNKYKLTGVSHYYGLRAVLTVVFAIIGAIAGFFVLNPLVTGILGGVFGYFILALDMKSASSTRSREVLKVLPETLDLLNVTMNAGQTFNSAFKETAKRVPESILKKDLMLCAAEIESGSPLASSLNSLEEKYNSEELKTFVRTVVRSSETGADISRALEQNSESIRSAYESSVIEKINKLGDKLVFIFIPFGLVPALVALLYLPVSSTMSNSGLF